MKEMRPAVVLERIKDNPEPDYCIHGRATCLGCGAWLWLGDKTAPLVAAGEVLPVCIPCMTFAADNGAVKIGNLGDRNRSEGPH